jgi:hypothetical protein
MTKSERLIYLINMIKNRKPLTVDQLSTVFEVTPRTIYRDLKTIMGINIPLQYDKGYRLAHENELPALDLGADDRELIRYCLRSSSLSDHPFFNRKFQLIERKICSPADIRMGADHPALMIIGDFEHKTTKQKDSALIEQFLRAGIESRKITLTFKNSKSCVKYLPVAFCMRNRNPFILVTRSFQQPPEESSLSNIVSINMNRDKFDHTLMNKYRSKWVSKEPGHDAPPQKELVPTR